MAAYRSLSGWGEPTALELARVFREAFHVVVPAAFETRQKRRDATELALDLGVRPVRE